VPGLTGWNELLHNRGRLREIKIALRVACLLHTPAVETLVQQAFWQFQQIYQIKDCTIANITKVWRNVWWGWRCFQCQVPFHSKLSFYWRGPLFLLLWPKRIINSKAFANHRWGGVSPPCIGYCPMSHYGLLPNMDYFITLMFVFLFDVRLFITMDGDIFSSGCGSCPPLQTHYCEGFRVFTVSFLCVQVTKLMCDVVVMVLGLCKRYGWNHWVWQNPILTESPGCWQHFNLDFKKPWLLLNSTAMWRTRWKRRRQWPQALVLQCNASAGIDFTSESLGSFFNLAWDIGWHIYAASASPWSHFGWSARILV